MDDETWSENLNGFTLPKFSCFSGLCIAIDKEAKLDEYFLQIFSEEILDQLVQETNRYARQSSESNERRRVSLAWRDVTKQELKAFFGISIIMGINRLPKLLITGEMTYLCAMKG